MNNCQTGGVSVWYAENLDVDALLDSHGRRIGEGALWLGHSVYVGMADDARCRDTGRVPLRAEYLRNVVGRHHLDAVREVARQVRYVNRDPSYLAGSRSQTYWIQPPYDRARLVRRQIIDPGLRHNILKWRESRHRAIWQRIHRNETAVNEAVCAHLWRNLQRVRIDTAIDYGEAFHPAHQIAVEHIREGELWFTVDDYGRIHTPLTCLSKVLRQYLAVDSDRLADIDISESQPLFMGMAIARIKSGEWAGGHAREAGTQARGGREGNGAGRRGPLSLMMDNTMMDKDTLLGGGFDRKRLPTDLRRYIELCEARGLYQAVADRLGKTRDDAKHGVMVAFYDRPWHCNATSAVLDNLFPTVMQAMRRMKQGDYCRLAHFAQRIESGFIFGRVVPRIMELRPDLFIATIHDSIMTTAGDADLVRQVMLEEFAQLGLSPQVKVEPCSGMLCEGDQEGQRKR